MSDDPDSRPVPHDALEEPLALFREGKLELAALAEILVRFGRSDHAEAPRATMAALLARELRHTVPADGPRTRQLRPRSAAKTAGPATRVGATGLDRFTTAAGVATTVALGLGPDSPAPTDPGDVRHAFGRVLGEGGVGVVRLAVDRDLSSGPTTR